VALAAREQLERAGVPAHLLLSIWHYLSHFESHGSFGSSKGHLFSVRIQSGLTEVRGRRLRLAHRGAGATCGYSATRSL